MLLAPKYYKLDLPVIDEDTPVVDVEAYGEDENFNPERYFAETGKTSFIRHIKVTTHQSHGTLNEVLKKTDEELEVIAELCGALVVGHTWALRNQNGKPNSYWCLNYAPNIVPAGHIVVAEVDLIYDLKTDASIPPYFNARITKGLKEYGSRDKQLLSDTDRRQFAVGVNARSAYLSESAWLLDIEPYLY